MPDLPCFIDFEANGVGESLPIEFAWSRPDGSVESHLIDPRSLPDGEVEWDEAAEDIHHITIEMLMSDGKPAAWIVDRFCGQVPPQAIYSDGPPFDDHWLTVLFDAARVPVAPYEVQSITKLPAIAALSPERFGAWRRQIKNAVVAGEHRAGWDVEYLVAMYRRASAEAY